jgi:hypothetical protein
MEIDALSVGAIWGGTGVVSTMAAVRPETLSTQGPLFGRRPRRPDPSNLGRVKYQVTAG